jgi:hypothetical protein
MKFEHLLQIVGDEPLFETGLLLAGSIDPNDVQRQLSRWVRAGRLYLLRRGLYALAPPFQKIKPHPFVIANHLVRGSIVSLHSALAHYGLIPDLVPVVTSVTARRPARWDTPLGVYEFRHVKAAWLNAYRLVEVSPGQQAFVATPEKALLDFAYLYPATDNPLYLQELRLQNLECIDIDVLQHLAEQSGKPKLRRFVAFVEELAHRKAQEYEMI